MLSSLVSMPPVSMVFRGEEEGEEETAFIDQRAVPLVKMAQIYWITLQTSAKRPNHQLKS